MMGIAKYFDFNEGVAKFVWRGENKTAFDCPILCQLYGNNGLVRAEVKGIKNNAVIYEQAYELESAFYIGGTTVGSDRLNIPANFPEQVDECIITILVYAPLSINNLYFPTQNTVTPIDLNGIKELKNSLYYQAYWSASIPLPEEIFGATNLENILLFSVPNISNLDPRLQGLINLKVLRLGFTPDGGINTSVLLGMQSLQEFLLWAYNITINDNYINFSTAFQANTTLKHLLIGRSGNYEKIPESISNLSLEKFSMEYPTFSTIQDNLMTYPLRSAADNTVLKQMIIVGNNLPTAKVLKYPNIEKLKALEEISHNVIYANEQKNIDQLNYFYELVYSKIYYKQGNTHSDTSKASGYFSTLAPVPTANGFVHSTFRKLKVSDNGVKCIDRDYSDKILEMRNDGLTMYGNYYSSIRRKGLQLNDNNVDYVLLPSDVVLNKDADWYVELEGVIGHLYIGSSGYFDTIGFSKLTSAQNNALAFTLQGSATNFLGNEVPTSVTNYDQNKYAKLRIEFDGTTNKLRVYYNLKLVYENNAITQKNNIIVRSIGVRAGDNSNINYPAGSSSQFCSQAFLSYLDINGETYDFNNTTGNQVTSSSSNTATIKTKHPDGATYINTMWQENTITI